jgi:PAS domain S-box-containing protein
MNNRFKRNLQIGYGISFLMLAAMGLLSYLTFRNLLASNREVEQSSLVIRKLEKTISLMKDAETGQRGYLLTGRKQFLQPYEGAYRQAMEQLDDAMEQTRGNLLQQNNLAAVCRIMLQRMTILQKLIDKRSLGQEASGAELEAGKAAMDTLRKAVDKAENDEQSLLDKHISELHAYSSWMPVMIIAAVILALLIVMTSYLNVTRDLYQKDRLRAHLEEKEQETAAYNEELTAANEEINAANEELAVINEELIEARDHLSTANATLEDRVNQRTQELMESEAETQALNEELIAINDELATANEEYQATNEDLLHTREELEKSEHLFRSVAENIPGSMVMVIGRDHQVLILAGDLLEQLHYNAKDHEGKHLSEVTSPERHETNRVLYDRMMAGERFRIGRKGDNGAVYQVDFVPLHEETGAIYAGLIIALDITDIKKAEERSAKLAAIVETSDDAIISKQLDGIVTSWNRSAERLFGYTEADMKGQSILRIIPDDRQEEEPQIIARIRNGEHMEHFETRRLTRDGNLIDVSLTISPILDSKGTIIGVSKIARDISEQKQDQQRKSDFIGMASHELKTPLTSLSALIQVLKLKLKNNPDIFIPTALERADLQVKKMSGLINGFLNVSRLESGKLVLDKKPFDLTELITDTINEMRLTVSSHTFVFEHRIALIVEADRDKISSVISNLLSNAVKYSPKGMIVTVFCETTDSETLVGVQDLGIGIPNGDQERLFERYYRVSSEHTRHISGFGVGLYLSAEIIKEHGGRIWVKSEPGHGATFFFSLPLAGS